MNGIIALLWTGFIGCCFIWINLYVINIASNDFIGVGCVLSTLFLSALFGFTSIMAAWVDVD